LIKSGAPLTADERIVLQPIKTKNVKRPTIKPVQVSTRKKAVAAEPKLLETSDFENRFSGLAGNAITECYRMLDEEMETLISLTNHVNCAIDQSMDDETK
jgi:hypothetical protein